MAKSSIFIFYFFGHISTWVLERGVFIFGIRFLHFLDRFSRLHFIWELLQTNWELLFHRITNYLIFDNHSYIYIYIYIYQCWAVLTFLWELTSFSSLTMLWEPDQSPNIFIYLGLVRTPQIINFLFFSNSPCSQIGQFSYIQQLLVFTFGFHNLIIQIFIN
jgi:hypothetical protein